MTGAIEKTLAAYGIDAVKGSWLDDHTFAVDRQILGHGESRRWTLAFESNKVDVKFESTTAPKRSCTASWRSERDMGAHVAWPTNCRRRTGPKAQLATVAR